MVKTYDVKSYELAEHFLQDEPCRNDPALYKRHADSLAKAIQQAVEDWFLSPDDDVEQLARKLCAIDGLDPDEHIIGGQAQGFEDYGPRWKCGGVTGIDYLQRATDTLRAAL